MKTLKTGIKTEIIKGRVIVYDKNETVKASIMERLSKLNWFSLVFRTIFLTLITICITSLIFAAVLGLVDLNNW